MRKLLLIVLICALALTACRPAVPAEPFDEFGQYEDWADSVGYESGALVPEGMDGPNQDRYLTPAAEPGYDSGRIVIGDSRCCQLGIYAQRAGIGDFAVYAAWGGHYLSEARPAILTDAAWQRIESCFKRQIEKRGKCTVFLFATVNDYDHTMNANEANIGACIAAAERLAGLTATVGGKEYSPRLVIIGFAGCKKGEPFYGMQDTDFNRYVDDYTAELRRRIEADEALKGSVIAFTSVEEIIGGDADFINDNLHYGDRTLKLLAEYVSSFK